MKYILAPALALFFMHSLHATNVIVNGHFETPNQPSGTFSPYPSIPGWAPRGAATAVYLVGTLPPIASWPLFGQGGSGQFADIGNTPGTGILQSVTIPIVFTSPEISWYDATSNFGSNPSNYTVRLLDSSNSVVTSSNYSTTVSTWTSRTLSGFGPLTPGTYTLEFEPTTGFGMKDTLIDNVQLIPEPSTGVLLVSLALGSALRRRRC